jgi:hypothetical protein
MRPVVAAQCSFRILQEMDLISGFSQLKKDYGGDQAAVIMNITGNVISGQVMGETSKLLAERFGKIT